MRVRLIALLLATTGAVLALASPASASADETNGACLAQFTSNQDAGVVGATISFLAHEEQPFGTTVPAYIPGLRPPCEG